MTVNKEEGVACDGYWQVVRQRVVPDKFSKNKGANRQHGLVGKMVADEEEGQPSCHEGQSLTYWWRVAAGSNMVPDDSLMTEEDE